MYKSPIQKQNMELVTLYAANAFNWIKTSSKEHWCKYMHGVSDKVF